LTADKRFEAQVSASSWEIFIEIDLVSWTNDEDCNLILFDVVIERVFVKAINKYFLVKDEIEIVEIGTSFETALSIFCWFILLNCWGKEVNMFLLDSRSHAFFKI